MDSPFTRFLDASGCRTQGELAVILGVRRALVIDAKKRNRIPEEWLRRLQIVRGVNPQWVLTGTGNKYMDNPGPWSACDAADVAPPELLRGYSSKTLADELLRRAAFYDKAQLQASGDSVASSRPSEQRPSEDP